MVRQHLESTYMDLVNVFEQKEVTRPNGSTGFEPVKVIDNEPCRLSFSSVNSANQGDGVATVVTVVRLFISPDIYIRPGSRLVVKHQGRENEYGLSGEPAIYGTHQEFVLQSFGGYT